MGCKNTTCQDPEEFLLSSSFNSVNDRILPSPTSQISTHPSINTVVRHKKQLTVSNRPFLQVQYTIECFLKSLPNYPELKTLLELWGEIVFSHLENEVNPPEDILSRIEIESTGENIILSHEVPVLITLNVIQSIARQMHCLKARKLSTFEDEWFRKARDFIGFIQPTSYRVYLKLGNDMDCGIGITKPSGVNAIKRFFAQCSELEEILDWQAEPPTSVPTTFMFSCLSNRRQCSFYIFERDKEANFEKATNLFSLFGASISVELSSCLLKSRNSDFYVGLEIRDNTIYELFLQSYGVQPKPETLQHLDTNVNLEWWTRFSKLLGIGLLSLNLSPRGFTMKHLAQIVHE